MMMNMMRAAGLPPPPVGGGGGRGGAGGDSPPAPPPPPVGGRGRDAAGAPPNFVSPGCPDPITLLSDVVGAPDAAIVKAVQQQLGLTLQSGKAPIETIVVDHLEKIPTEN